MVYVIKRNIKEVFVITTNKNKALDYSTKKGFIVEELKK